MRDDAGDAPRYTIRLARADEDFILALVPRFAAFALPPWRKRHETIEGIRRDLADCLENQPIHDCIYVAEDESGQRVGFIRLQKTRDFFNYRSNAHISDLAIALAHEGHGVARALLNHAERWAREHQCHLITLAVFPGNARARALYAQAGFELDLLRLAKPLA